MTETILRWKCDNCRIILDNPMTCSKCKAATYCNLDCQRSHWKEHKKVCCIDIQNLTSEQMQELAAELIKIVKSDDNLMGKIVTELNKNFQKCLIVLSAIRNRKINCFQQLEISSMSVIEYQQATKTNHPYDLHTASLYFILKSERNQIMVNGALPLDLFI